jgi:phage host-nuclease inhibitor protein Gam
LDCFSNVANIIQLREVMLLEQHKQPTHSLLADLQEEGSRLDILMIQEQTIPEADFIAQRSELENELRMLPAQISTVNAKADEIESTWLAMRTAMKSTGNTAH